MTDSKHPAGHVLQAFHDGELGQILAAEVEEHCGQCKTCRAELAELELTVQFLAGSPAPELPRTVWHRVKPGRRSEPRFKPVFGLVAGAAGIVLGILLGPIQTGSETATNELAWSESVTVWTGSATSPLLGVYQTGQE